MPQASCTILISQTWLKGDVKLRGGDSESIEEQTHHVRAHTLRPEEERPEPRACEVLGASQLPAQGTDSEVS